MRQASGIGRDLLHLAYQVLHHIHIMHALVHQRAAAVQLPGSPPACGVIVSLVPVVLQIGVGQDDPAEFSLLDRLPHGDGGGHQPALEDALHLGAVLLHHPDDLVDLFRSDLHGLFADDGLPRVGGRDADLPVKAAGDADADRLHLRVGQERMVIVVDLLHPLLRRKGVGFFREDVADGVEAALLRFLHSGGVGVGNDAAADNGKIHGFQQTHPFWWDSFIVA